jgi:hypothetical protein
MQADPSKLKEKSETQTIAKVENRIREWKTLPEKLPLPTRSEVTCQSIASCFTWRLGIVITHQQLFKLLQMAA